jgi:hypothetical protein
MLKTILLVLALSTQLVLFADTSEGETLEKKMWEYIQKKNWNEFEKNIATYFQGADFNGVFNKEQYISQVKVANIGDYKLSNFKVTESPGVVVVSYDIAVSEVIGGKSISSKASRLSVWQKNGNNWLWIAHAALIPVPAADAKK